MSAEQQLGTKAQENMEDLFPPVVDNRYDEPIRFKDVPYITRPIVEHLHAHPPDVVIAADRDGRIPAFGIWQAWKRHYPGERFPTADHRIWFARVTSRSAKYTYVEKATHFALAQAGVPRHWMRDHSRKSGAEPPSVMLIDDWPVNGGVARRFTAAAFSYGLPAEAITYATLCGIDISECEQHVEGILHLRGDPDRHPRLSDWYDDSMYSGVWYGSDEDDAPFSSVTPEGYTSRVALNCREQIAGYMDAYYANYTAVLAAGRAATGAIVHAA